MFHCKGRNTVASMKTLQTWILMNRRKHHQRKSVCLISKTNMPFLPSLRFTMAQMFSWLNWLESGVGGNRFCSVPDLDVCLNFVCESEELYTDPFRYTSSCFVFVHLLLTRSCLCHALQCLWVTWVTCEGCVRSKIYNHNIINFLSWRSSRLWWSQIPLPFGGASAVFLSISNLPVDADSWRSAFRSCGLAN